MNNIKVNGIDVNTFIEYFVDDYVVRTDLTETDRETKTKFYQMTHMANGRIYRYFTIYHPNYIKRAIWKSIEDDKYAANNNIEGYQSSTEQYLNDLNNNFSISNPDDKITVATYGNISHSDASERIEDYLYLNYIISLEPTRVTDSMYTIKPYTYIYPTGEIAYDIIYEEYEEFGKTLVIQHDINTLEEVAYAHLELVETTTHIYSNNDTPIYEVFNNGTSVGFLFKNIKINDIDIRDGKIMMEDINGNRVAMYGNGLKMFLNHHNYIRENILNIKSKSDIVNNINSKFKPAIYKDGLKYKVGYVDAYDVVDISTFEYKDADNVGGYTDAEVGVEYTDNYNLANGLTYALESADDGNDSYNDYKAISEIDTTNISTTLRKENTLYDFVELFTINDLPNISVTKNGNIYESLDNLTLNEVNGSVSVFTDRFKFNDKYYYIGSGDEVNGIYTDVEGKNPTTNLFKIEKKNTTDSIANIYVRAETSWVSFNDVNYYGNGDSKQFPSNVINFYNFSNESQEDIASIMQILYSRTITIIDKKAQVNSILDSMIAKSGATSSTMYEMMEYVNNNTRSVINANIDLLKDYATVDSSGSTIVGLVGTTSSVINEDYKDIINNGLSTINSEHIEEAVLLENVYNVVMGAILEVFDRFIYTNQDKMVMSPTFAVMSNKNTRNIVAMGKFVEGVFASDDNDANTGAILFTNRLLEKTFNDSYYAYVTLANTAEETPRFTLSGLNLSGFTYEGPKSVIGNRDYKEVLDSDGNPTGELTYNHDVKTYLFDTNKIITKYTSIKSQLEDDFDLGSVPNLMTFRELIDYFHMTKQYVNNEYYNKRGSILEEIDGNARDAEIFRELTRERYVEGKDIHVMNKIETNTTRESFDKKALIVKSLVGLIKYDPRIVSAVDKSDTINRPDFETVYLYKSKEADDLILMNTMDILDIKLTGDEIQDIIDEIGDEDPLERISKFANFPLDTMREQYNIEKKKYYKTYHENKTKTSSVNTYEETPLESKYSRSNTVIDIIDEQNNQISALYKSLSDYEDTEMFEPYKRFTYNKIASVAENKVYTKDDDGTVYSYTVSNDSTDDSLKYSVLNIMLKHGKGWNF